MTAPSAIIIGSVVGAAGSIAAGNAEKKAAQQNAVLARMKAEEDARLAARQSSAVMGRQRAIVAASGTTLAGSPLLIAQDAAREAEIELRHIRRGGAARASAYERAGDAAARAGFIDAGATLLGGISKVL